MLPCLNFPFDDHKHIFFFQCRNRMNKGKENDLENFSIDKIMSLLASTSKSNVADQLQTVIDEYLFSQNNIPAKQVDAYSEPQLETVLSHYGVSSDGGDRFSVIRQLKTLPEKCK